MKIRKLKDIPEIKGKKILLRVDFNVPLKENGDIQDDTRIAESLPTIQKLQKEGARIIILSHLGRPDGKIDEKLRLTKIAQHLSKLLGKDVKKSSTILGEESQKLISKMVDGDIVMLENIRFVPEEEKCETEFTKKLAKLGEIFVNDAFGTAHRKHASTAGLADYLPSYAGLLMEKEITALSPLLSDKIKKPLVMIFGGAKIDTKIGVIKNFIDKADYFLMGGALANTFLAAAGYNVANSLYEKDKIKIAREIMLECEKHQEKLVLPHDVVAANKISDYAKTLHLPIEDVMGNVKILDIGKWTAEKFCNVIAKAGTVIWNGPLGLSEYKPFQEGTKTVAAFLAKQKCVSILGGGDTADAINRLKIDEKGFSHISTGGGACIEFLSGEKLPGIEVLKA